MDKNAERAETKHRRKWILLLLVIVIIIVAGILISQSRTSRIVAEAESLYEVSNGGVELFIDPYAKNTPSQEGKNAGEQGVAIAGMESIIISSGKKEVSVDFYNPEENTGLYYLSFELRIYSKDESESEVLYTSGLVEPGKSLKKITLSRELEKGEYKAVLHVQPYRMNEEKTLTNNADINVRLIVE